MAFFLFSKDFCYEGRNRKRRLFLITNEVSILFKKENLMTTSFILLIVVLIGAAVFGAFFKKDENIPTTLKTETDMAFALEEQPVSGNVDAPVTLTVFYDYNCPHCGKWEKEIYPILESDVLSTDLVNLRFVNYPFMNPTSTVAAMAAELVHDKKPEAFVAFHNDVFSNQLAISTNSLAEKVNKHVPDVSVEEAKEILTKQTYIDHVLSDRDYANEKKVSSTPSLFVGDQLVENAFDLAAIQALINAQLKTTEGEKADELPEEK